MSLRRRITAALTSALLLQFTLLGSGAPCTMRGGGRSPAQTRAVMHAGGSGPTVSPVPEAPASAPALPGGRCDARGTSDSCGGPWMPEGCASMALCHADVPAPAALSAALAAAPARAELPEPLAANGGPALAPELPPPRA